MKVDFSIVLHDQYDEPMNVAIKPGVTAPATLAHVAVEALLALKPEATGAEKVACYALAMRLVKGGKQDVSAEDVVLVKSKIAEAFAPIVVGRSYDLLDQRVIGEA